MKETGLCLPGVLLRDLCSSPPMTMQGVPAKGTLPLLQKVGYVDMELECVLVHSFLQWERPHVVGRPASLVALGSHSLPPGSQDGNLSSGCLVSMFAHRPPPTPPPLWVETAFPWSFAFPRGRPAQPASQLAAGVWQWAVGHRFSGQWVE